MYLAVGVYQTNDGGALVASQQVPASINGNGNLDDLEFFVLQLVAAPGDYNRDGDVDDADLTLWQSTLGSQSDLRADGNGNNRIDAADYVVWRKNYGATGAGGYVLSLFVNDSAQTQVPEPASFVPILWAPVGINLRYRHLRSLSERRKLVHQGTSRNLT